MSAADADLTAGAVDWQPPQEGIALPAHWRLLDRLEKTAIGTRKPHGVTTVRHREPAGCLLYGPYWQLPSGVYRLDFRCRSGKPRLPGAPVLGVEVIAMNRVQLAWLDLTARELAAESGSVEFSIPTDLGLGAGDEARLEFRFFHLGNADLTIGAIDLRLVHIGEISPPQTRSWRLLGRVEKAMIAKRGRHGFTVRRAARPGRLLDAGRPLLQLPRGNYRLDFACCVGAACMTSQPVLGVEVVASRRWREPRLWRRSAAGEVQRAWADFTPMQLRTGGGSVDFTVPAELSLESGQEVLFGFRFVHLGNADLAISAVDLHRKPDQEKSPRVPREWRLLGRLVKGVIGTRDCECVRVRQSEPAGVLLYGGRPDLPLPAGRFRLKFSCRTGPPRDRSGPLLQVSIVVRGRVRGGRFWPQWPGPRRVLREAHGFTSEELQNGSGCLDFEVPAGPGGDDEPSGAYEFEFRHLGNADLEIGGVELSEIIVDQLRTPLRPPIAAHKTTVVIIGNCQAQTVHEAFVRSAQLNTRFDARYHFVGLQRNLHELGRTELENCDILLVQDIRDWENYPLRRFVRDDLPVVKFPLLHFASLWPFDHYNGPGDKEAYEREWPNLAFLYQDGLLARLRKEIPDPEARLAAYRSLSVEGIINYVRLHDFERRRLTAMDRQFGFDIGKHILENFRSRKLFYTTNHPNGPIIAMLIQYLLKNIGIDETYRPTASLDHLNRLQVPVHPKVAEALGVKWANENTRYLYGGERISWETYVRRYIDHYG